MMEVANLVNEYKILSTYLINKIKNDKYIDKEELKDLLISFGFSFEEKHEEEKHE